MRGENERGREKKRERESWKEIFFSVEGDCEGGERGEESWME